MTDPETAHHPGGITVTRLVEVEHPPCGHPVGGKDPGGAAALGTPRVVPDDHIFVGHATTVPA